MESPGEVEPVSPPAVDEGYRAGALLGSGRRARVWSAVRTSDGARFALKIAADAPGGHVSTFETRRELNVLSRLEHENLLHLHTVVETDHGPGLLMELAPGGSLARVLYARGTLQPGEAVTVLVGIASVLAYLHALNICHGEVSTNNILFAAGGKPLLGDLGSSGLLGAGTVPEAAEADDVLALAEAGWLMLTGRALPPAERRLPLVILVPEIPAALAEAIDAGLHQDPERRPDAAEFARRVFESTPAKPLDLALGAAVPGDGLQTRRSRLDQGRASTGLRRWVRRESPGSRHRDGSLRGDGPNRLLLGAAAILVLATMGLGAVAVAAPDLLQGTEPGAAGAAPSIAPSSTPSPSPSPTPSPSVSADGAQSAGAEQQPSPEGTRDTDAGPGLEDPAKGEEAPVSTEPGGQASLARAAETELELMVRGTDPAAAARALGELRARAFTAADAGLLPGINAPGSPAMQADEEEIAKLAAAGTVLSGLSVEIESAGPPVAGPEGRVSLRAAVFTSAYEERGTGGEEVRTVAAVSSQDVVLVLLPTADGWRIEDILAPPA